MYALLLSDSGLHSDLLCLDIFSKQKQRWEAGETVCVTHPSQRQCVWNWIHSVLNCYRQELVFAVIPDWVNVYFYWYQEAIL